MWDPTCLISPACEETNSVYRLSTPPTPLLDEPMPSPQKPSPAKERLQTVTEEVEVVKEVTVKKGRRKVQSRSDLLAQAFEQARITSPPSPSPKPNLPLFLSLPNPIHHLPNLPLPPKFPSPNLPLLKRKPPPHPKFPSPLLPSIPVMAALVDTLRQCSRW